MYLSNAPLGKKTEYLDLYNRNLLFSISRKTKREEIGLTKNCLPFSGVDIWNAYEISWLNNKGKPCVAFGEIIVNAESNNIVESKSLKLYLNSYNNTKFPSMFDVQETIAKDLSEIVGHKTVVRLKSLNDKTMFGQLEGENIDDIDIESFTYEGADANILVCEDIYINETLNSHLLKSNCLVTGQPDWGSIAIKYSGKRIDRSSLLKYIVSFRNYNAFHEQCVEKIFINIYDLITPNYLSVYARYTRRGGIDICPYRTTENNFDIPNNHRLVRQ